MAHDLNCWNCGNASSGSAAGCEARTIKKRKCYVEQLGGTCVSAAYYQYDIAADCKITNESWVDGEGESITKAQFDALIASACPDLSWKCGKDLPEFCEYMQGALTAPVAPLATDKIIVARGSACETVELADLIKDVQIESLMPIAFDDATRTFSFTITESNGDTYPATWTIPGPVHITPTTLSIGGVPVVGTGAEGQSFNLPAYPVETPLVVVLKDSAGNNITATNVVQSGTANHIAEITLPPQTVDVNVSNLTLDAAGNLLLTETDGQQHQVNIPSSPALVVTKNGSTAGVLQSGTLGHTVDIAVETTEVYVNGVAVPDSDTSAFNRRYDITVPAPLVCPTAAAVAVELCPGDELVDLGGPNCTPRKVKLPDCPAPAHSIAIGDLATGTFTGSSGVAQRQPVTWTLVQNDGVVGGSNIIGNYSQPLTANYPAVMQPIPTVPGDWYVIHMNTAWDYGGPNGHNTIVNTTGMGASGPTLIAEDVTSINQMNLWLFKATGTSATYTVDYPSSYKINDGSVYSVHRAQGVDPTLTNPVVQIKYQEGNWTPNTACGSVANNPLTMDNPVESGALWLTFNRHGGDGPDGPTDGVTFGGTGVVELSDYNSRDGDCIRTIQSATSISGDALITQHSNAGDHNPTIVGGDICGSWAPFRSQAYGIELAGVLAAAPSGPTVVTTANAIGVNAAPACAGCPDDTQYAVKWNVDVQLAGEFDVDTRYKVEVLVNGGVVSTKMLTGAEIVSENADFWNVSGYLPSLIPAGGTSPSVSASARVTPITDGPATEFTITLKTTLETLNV